MPGTSVELPVWRGPELAQLGTAGHLPILEKHLRAWLERPSEGALVVVVGERGIDITSHRSGGRPTTRGETYNDRPTTWGEKVQ